MKNHKLILKTIGIIAIVVAVFGLCYNLSNLFLVFDDSEETIPYFYPAFYIMSSICIICYIILIFTGIKLCLLNTKFLKIFSFTLHFEIVYFLVISFMCLVPQIGKGIAAATGIANGGLMVQAVILFPFWAPYLATLAAKNIIGSSNIEPYILEDKIMKKYDFYNFPLQLACLGIGLMGMPYIDKLTSWIDIPSLYGRIFSWIMILLFFARRHHTYNSKSKELKSKISG